MAKVITFSRKFPKGHAKAGSQTYFVEQILKYLNIKTCSESYLNWLISNNPNLERYVLVDFQKSLIPHDNAKVHTIRGSKNFDAGEVFSPRVWTGKPYMSKQLIFAPEIIIKNIFPVTITIESGCDISIIKDRIKLDTSTVAINDGLTKADFFSWFNNGVKDSKEEMYVICWGIEGY